MSAQRAMAMCVCVALRPDGYARLLRVRDAMPAATLADFDSVLFLVAQELAERGKFGSAGGVLGMRGMPQRAVSFGARP